MDFHKNLSDNKSPQVFRTLRSILAYPNNAFVVQLLYRFALFKYPSICEQGLEYYDGLSGREIRALQKGCLGDDTLLHLMVKIQLRDLGNEEYFFIAITPTSTRTRSGSSFLSFIHGQNRFEKLFLFELCVKNKPSKETTTNM